MKFVKFGVFAFALAMFAVSCGESTTEETTEETTEMEAPAVEETAPMTESTEMMDSTATPAEAAPMTEEHSEEAAH